MFLCEFRVAWQTDGATPLCAASYQGHVECVRALLGGGAAINQANVGFLLLCKLAPGFVCAGMCEIMRACMD